MFRLHASREVVPGSMAEVRPLKASSTAERLSGARMLSCTDVRVERKRMSDLSVFSKLIHAKDAGSAVWLCVARAIRCDGSANLPANTTPASAVYADATTSAEWLHRRQSRADAAPESTTMMGSAAKASTLRSSAAASDATTSTMAVHKKRGREARTSRLMSHAPAHNRTGRKSWINALGANGAWSADHTARIQSESSDDDGRPPMYWSCLLYTSPSPRD